jgi:hypothetical protein
MRIIMLLSGLISIKTYGTKYFFFYATLSGSVQQSNSNLARPCEK